MHPTTSSPPSKPTRAAIYARVSTLDQEPENQLAELRTVAARNGWTAVEYVDHGVSGAKDSRPALDRLMTDARRRAVDVVMVWRLDRFGRSLRHIVTTLDDLQARGVAFVSLGEGIDLATPAGKLQLHILAALAEFERSRIQERIKAGLVRARAQGRQLGRRPAVHPKSAAYAVVADLTLSGSEAARRLNISKATVNAMRRQLRTGQQSPAADRPATADTSPIS